MKHFIFGFAILVIASSAALAQFRTDPATPEPPLSTTDNGERVSVASTRGASGPRAPTRTPSSGTRYSTDPGPAGSR